MIEPEPLQLVDRTYAIQARRKLLYFAGCDYFRLASDPRVVAAVATGAKRYGVNVAASRLTTGNHRLYQELEQELARFFRSETAVLVPTGYLGNLVVCQALRGEFTRVLVDERSHPALYDAARFLDCPIIRFKHRQVDDLARAVAKCRKSDRVLLMTDGLFSHDGSAAPLGEYLRVLPQSAWMLVDDAHAAGVLGRTGRGTHEHAGIGRERLFQTVTLSKAFGTYGGAIVGSRKLRQAILDRSRLFVGSTPLPLPLAHAALCSLRRLAHAPDLLTRLRKNAEFLKAGLRAAGFEIPTHPGPIVALHPRSPKAARRLGQALRAAGIFPSLIKYVSGPENGYYRFVISSQHSRTQLSLLVDTIRTHATPADFR